nr:phosphoribosyl-anthranilate isomerase [uncultured bacterium]
MKIKICGLTHPDDAKCAVSSGADFIGIIFAERSRRKVSLSMAKGIAEITKNLKAEPVAVFDNQTADQIFSICDKTGIKTVQLHGAVSKQALCALSDKYSVIYAIEVNDQGEITPSLTLPPSVIPLYDNVNGGTGLTFNQSAFTPPDHTGWLLAGGLTPDNVAQSIALLNPGGVDVSTGVEIPGSTRKNPILVKAFIRAAKNVKDTL